jgi:hypothetical protein
VDEKKHMDNNLSRSSSVQPMPWPSAERMTWMDGLARLAGWEGGAYKMGRVPRGGTVAGARAGRIGQAGAWLGGKRHVGKEMSNEVGLCFTGITNITLKYKIRP